MNENDSGRIYHIFRKGRRRMVVRECELKDDDIIVGSADYNDNLNKLEADIDYWLCKWPGLSVRVADIKEEIMNWLDRRAAIAEHQTERKWCCYEGSVQAEIDKLTRERDALADDLAECMEKRDYWKQEVQYCMDAAYPPSHAPERPYDPRVMAYPDREGCTTPSTLVSAMIDGLRDDVRDTVMPIVEESVKAKAECERWRDACGSMMDAAHEIERIMREFEEK